MTLLYQKIKIPNFDEKQEELKELVKVLFPDKLHLTYYDPSFSEMKSKCPTLTKYILEKSKSPLRLFRVYHSPAGNGLRMHIDGGAFNRSPIGLNLPIINCKNSLMKWWDESNAKIVTGNFGYAGISASKILNPEELKCLGQVEIDQPTFVRTDHIHSVENYNKDSRIIISIRWMYDKINGQNFNQVFDYEPYNE